jgi:hypothetical protein
MSTKRQKFQKATSFDGLFKKLSDQLDGIEDHRASNTSYRLGDVLRSAFAMFSLKFPSLLGFEQRSREETKNLLNIYRIREVPSDSQMRKILDEVNPAPLRQSFRSFYELLRQTKVVKEYEYFEGMSLVSVDGVEHFCSNRVHCEQCTTKQHRNGQTSYHHALLAAVMVHPDKREVFPLDCEPIICQDGSTKNDCEQNAAKRLLEAMGRRYSDSCFVLVEDALYSNGPHIRQLTDMGWHYILNVKPDSHKSLFAQVEGRRNRGQLLRHEVIDPDGSRHVFEYTNEVALNDSATDVRVNFLAYQEYTPDGRKKHTGSWITDFQLSSRNVYRIMRAGRSRWKIENETFNTLKNQGYNFEHNYGHGYQYLSTVLALLMFLAFTIDQIQQHCCELFQKLWNGLGTKTKLWECLRSFFKALVFRSMETLFKRIATSFDVQLE